MSRAQLFIHGFIVSAGSDLVSIELSASCRPAVNPELAEGKEEELDILPSLEGGVIV
jgi:hypothetical protein